MSRFFRQSMKIHKEITENLLTKNEFEIVSIYYEEVIMNIGHEYRFNRTTLSQEERDEFLRELVRVKEFLSKALNIIININVFEIDRNHIRCEIKYISGSRIKLFFYNLFN